jgi:hypothetical protein
LYPIILKKKFESIIANKNMLEKTKELLQKFENHIKFIKNENKPLIDEARECLILHKSFCVEFEKNEKRISLASSNELDWYYKNIKAKFFAYFFYFDMVLDCENFKLKNNFKNWKMYFNFEKEKIENSKYQFSEFLPLINLCFDDHFFSHENCSKGFKLNLWDSLNKLNAEHDIILAYLFATNIIEQYLFEQIKRIEFIENCNSDSLIEWHGLPISFIEVKLSLIISKYLKDETLSQYQLIQKLSYLYKVDISNLYRAIGEIRTRKGPKGKVLNKVKNLFEEKL